MKKKSNGILFLAAIAAGLFVLKRKRKEPSTPDVELDENYTEIQAEISPTPIIRDYINGMSDPMPTIENLKRGIENGWYSAKITAVNGKPAVRLSGKLTNGKEFSDVYPISESVKNELKEIGVQEL